MTTQTRLMVERTMLILQGKPVDMSGYLEWSGCDDQFDCTKNPHAGDCDMCIICPHHTG